MTWEEDIDAQIKMQQSILAEVPKKIAELESTIKELRDFCTGASYSLMVLKTLKVKNAVKLSEAPGAPAPAPPPSSDAAPFHDGLCICTSSPPGFMAQDGIHCGACGGVVDPPKAP